MKKQVSADDMTRAYAFFDAARLAWKRRDLPSTTENLKNTCQWLALACSEFHYPDYSSVRLSDISRMLYDRLYNVLSEVKQSKGVISEELFNQWSITIITNSKEELARMEIISSARDDCFRLFDEATSAGQEGFFDCTFHQVMEMKTSELGLAMLEEGRRLIWNKETRKVQFSENDNSSDC